MLHPCRQCQRHVRDHETRCPFCGASVETPSSLVSVREGRLSRAAVFASAVLAAPACYVSDPPPPRYVQQQPPPPYDPPPDDNVQPPPDGRYAQPPPGDPPPAVDDAKIRGVVIDAQTGAGYANLTVRLQGGPRPLFAVTDPSGNYVFAGLAPGDYYVVPQTRNPQPARQVHVDAHRDVVVNVTIAPPPVRPYDPNMNAKPYGAPPARRRVV